MLQNAALALKPKTQDLLLAQRAGKCQCFFGRYLQYYGLNLDPGLWVFELQGLYFFLFASGCNFLNRPEIVAPWAKSVFGFVA